MWMKNGCFLHGWFCVGELMDLVGSFILGNVTTLLNGQIRHVPNGLKGQSMCPVSIKILHIFRQFVLPICLNSLLPSSSSARSTLVRLRVSEGKSSALPPRCCYFCCFSTLLQQQHQQLPRLLLNQTLLLQLVQMDFSHALLNVLGLPGNFDQHLTSYKPSHL